MWLTTDTTKTEYHFSDHHRNESYHHEVLNLYV